MVVIITELRNLFTNTCKLFIQKLLPIAFVAIVFLKLWELYSNLHSDSEFKCLFKQTKNHSI